MLVEPAGAGVESDTLIEGFSHFVTSMTAPIASGWSGCRMGFAAVRLLHPMACPSTNSEVQDLFAKLLEKRFDRQPCCAGILYECMRFLTGHYKVNAAEEFLSFGCFRTEHRLVSAYINRIINVAWCFGHGILLDPEAGILRPFQPVLQGGNWKRLFWRSEAPRRAMATPAPLQVR
jgi:hypothetical protein